MRLVLIAIVTLWGIGALAAVAVTADKVTEAKVSAAYLGLWPAAALLVFINQPAPLWIAFPVIVGFVPWFLCGPHLWMVVHDPDKAQADQIVGIPKELWKWGLLVTVLLGVVGDSLFRP